MYRNVANVGSFECRGVKVHLSNTSWGRVALVGRVFFFVYICLCNEGNLRILEAIQFLHTVTVLHESILVCSSASSAVNDPSSLHLTFRCTVELKAATAIFCGINMLQCIFLQRQHRCYHCPALCLTCIM